MDPKDKLDLLKIMPFDLSQYEQFSLTTLTAYCIYWLGEWSITTTLENTTVVSHKMFPAKFALVGWPQFPDANRTNRSILQMRPKYRNLASSASDKGVFLNQRGIEEATFLIGQIGAPLLEGEARKTAKVPLVKAERGKGRARSVHPEDQLDRVHKSQLYAFYAESRFEEAQAIHLIGLLGVYDHTPSKEKRRKLKELVDAAFEVGDKQTQEFLKKVSEKFQKYLNK